MFRHLRHRWSQILRTSVLLVLALGLMVQPVLGALGEVHEFTAHTDSAHGHTDHNLPHEHAVAAQADDERDVGGPMHQLLHYAHCCGHSAGLASAELPLPSFHWVATPPGDSQASSVVPSHATTPFRPPISA